MLLKDSYFYPNPNLELEDGAEAGGGQQCCLLGNVGICQCGDTFKSSRWRRGWIFPEIFLLQQPNFRFVWIALWPCVAFLLLSSLTQSSKFTVMNRWIPVPRPSETCGSNTVVGARRPVVQLLWMLFVPVEHCDIWPFILSSLPVNQCIMSSTVNFREKRSSFPSGLTPIVPKKTKKRGKIFYSEMNSQPFTVKKSTLYVGLWFTFEWECNKDSTRFPIENSKSKKLEAKVSGAKLLEKSWKFSLAFDSQNHLVPKKISPSVAPLGNISSNLLF